MCGDLTQETEANRRIVVTYNSPAHWGTTVDYHEPEKQAPTAAVSGTDAILFSVTIDDHDARLDWLNMWIHGQWSEMHRDYPEFLTDEWRKP